MRSILLFVNGKLGLGVINFLLTQPETEITAVVLNKSIKRTESYTSEVLKVSPTLRLFEYSENLHVRSEFQEILAASNLAVSALFGHIIPGNLISPFGSNFINLHPSLLPFGRGADPIPWAVIENKQQGVSLHVLENKLDSGAIISQCAIDTTLAMTSEEIYDRAMLELLRLFREFIKNWPAGINYTPQVGDSSLHTSSELKALRNELARGSTEMENSLRVIQALTFKDGRTPRLRLSNGELWEITLSMSRVVD